MRLSDAGRALIKGFEGLSLTAYRDAGGYSIGYGHYGAKAGDIITRAEADRLFDEDVRKFEEGVSRYTPVASQHQFDAMVSLAYNIGVGEPRGSRYEGGFAASTVALKHNARDYAGAAAAFALWNKSQGQVLPVLIRRREREAAIYANGHVSGGGGSFGGSGASGSWEPAPSSAPVPTVNSSGRIDFSSIPAPSSARGAGAFLVGLGLLFFCPCCGAELDKLEVKSGSRKTQPPAGG